ncbi:transposable element Tcb2 transposase [Trichonephila clavipes]|nr:transposable element Tcb2 transposase [Trichonephila clavipes]
MLPLTPTHRRLRLEWCRARGNWNAAEWNQVVFSDESRFNLSSNGNCVRMWRPLGERLNPAFDLQQHTAPTAGVMVLSVIAYNTRSSLVLIYGTMTAQRYVCDILQSHVLPPMQRLPGAIFQQDNTRPHMAKVSQDCLHTVTALPWPSRSPDLSPIEHIWDHLGLRVVHLTSLNELEEVNSKYGAKCIKTSYRTCMPQCPIVSHRAFALEGVQQDGDRFNSCQVIYSQFGLAIHQNDHQARRRFVEWAQNEVAVVPDFHKRILFSDEAHFWLNGYVNKQNCRIWSEANPQVYVETPLHPEKLTVWCALWAGGILLQKR